MLGFVMNKKICFILALIAMAFLIIGTVSAGWFDFLGDEHEETKIINNDSVFIVGFSEDFPPYGFKNASGNYTGFDLDLAREVAKRNNWTFVEQPIDWYAKDLELDSASIDCIWNGFTINGREDEYTWSEPYVTNEQVVVVKEDSGINSFHDLKGKKVEAKTDSSGLKYLQESEKPLSRVFSSLKDVVDYEIAFEDLESGKCDAIVTDICVAQYHINYTNNSANLKILNHRVSSEQYGVGFKLGNTELRDTVQKTLDEMFADGTVQKIAENYSDSGIPDRLIYK